MASNNKMTMGGSGFAPRRGSGFVPPQGGPGQHSGFVPVLPVARPCGFVDFRLKLGVLDPKDVTRHEGAKAAPSVASGTVWGCSSMGHHWSDCGLPDYVRTY